MIDPDALSPAVRQALLSSLTRCLAHAERHGQTAGSLAVVWGSGKAEKRLLLTLTQVRRLVKRLKERDE